MPKLFYHRAWLSSILLLSLAGDLSSAEKKAQPARQSPFDTSVQPFLAKNCYACHSSRVASGGLDLTLLRSASSVHKDPERWERIVERLKAGEMPPKGFPKPKVEDVQVVTRWLQSEFERAERLAKPDPGRVVARRLNRTEYNYTVRDLLGVRFRPADDFPQDDSAHGFDNIADALSLSPTLMEKYMAAAEGIAKVAVFGPEIVRTTDRYYPPTPRRMENNPVQLTKPSYYSVSDYDDTGLAHPGSYHVRREFQADGEYLVRLYANGGRPPGSEPGKMALWLDGKIVGTFEVPDVVTAGNERAQVPVETRVKVSAGTHEFGMSFLKQFEGLPASFGGANPSSRPVPVSNRPRSFTPRKFEGLYAYQIDIEGPVTYTKGPAPESVQKILSCGHLNGSHQPACERTILSGLARRAFRRPVKSDEIDGLLSLFSGARTRGAEFNEALALAIQAILVAPDFLFRIEADQGQATGTSRRINSHELASRLSYFLWSSMPDDELLRLADTRRLSSPEVLAAQVRRMLRDEKSKRLAENFGGQWLETRKLESMLPDRDRFPDFEDYLRSSMIQETELFLDHVIRTDQSVLDFIDAKYSFLNERLARHYGIQGVRGNEFRRVDISGTNRSGILTHGSVLTASSFVNRTSPVLRGKWILENILNAPPPPPPPDVPNIDEDKAGVSASLRETLELHRKNPVCASCHSRMDPLGFALENYDAIGAWRTHDGKFPVDATGSLPDGRTINKPEDLKAILRADKATFAVAVTEKLLTYALGRAVERSDRPAVRRIVAQAAVDNYKFSNLVLAIVNSTPFQNKRIESHRKDKS